MEGVVIVVMLSAFLQCNGGTFLFILIILTSFKTLLFVFQKSIMDTTFACSSDWATATIF